ncbi:MAG: TPM domain-containing protein [Sulfuricella sp.]|nr:TPM domain-containing protein [Sulfuricella sp.]
MTALWRILFVFWLFLVSGAAVAEVAVPALQARVTDLSGTLTAQQSSELEAMLRAFEARKGSQIAVLLVPTTQPETIEQYAIRVAEQWKLGRKGVDDGALLLIARQDRAMRIEVGYGLEGALPDAVAKRIISETITPYFRQGDFYGGIRAGLEAMIKVIDGEPLPPARAAGRGTAREGVHFFENTLPVAMLFIFVVGGLLRTFLGRFLGALVAGGVSFFGAWLLLGSFMTALVIALIVSLITIAGGSRGGPFIGGGGSGGFGGGGGFSGGGGSFGGGGASGRW